MSIECHQSIEAWSVTLKMDRRIVEFMAGQPVSEASNWQPNEKSLPDALKDFTEDIASLPVRLERRMQAMQDQNRDMHF